MESGTQQVGYAPDLLRDDVDLQNWDRFLVLCYLSGGKL